VAAVVLVGWLSNVLTVLNQVGATVIATDVIRFALPVSFAVSTMQLYRALSSG